MGIGELLGALPVFRGERDVIKDEQDTPDIVNEILRSHKIFEKDYDRISSFFLGDIEKNLFSFLKDNIPYRLESGEFQTLRSPGGILAMKEVGCDCKHYASWIAGCISSLERKGLWSGYWCYRFASYDILSPAAKHVFVVVKKDGKEVWIDPVLKSFDSREIEPVYFTDKKPDMSLVRISGVPDNILSSVTRQSRAELSRERGLAGGCGCGCGKSISGVDISSFIQQNPVESMIVAGALGFLVYKLSKL